MASRSAGAGACGDDVGGVRVECSCGDIVVSDTTLTATDPVVNERCRTDGLIVATPSGGRGLIVNLGGLTLSGSGVGSGLRVVRGGSDGVVVVGGDEQQRATVRGFRYGLSAEGRNVLREVRNVDLVANARDGMHVRSSGLRAESVTASGNGRDGVRVWGHGSTLTGVDSTENLGNGLRVGGSGTTVRARSAGNGENGAFVTGRGHDLSGSQLRGNGGAGLMASGREHVAPEAGLEGNARGPVAGPKAALQ